MTQGMTMPKIEMVSLDKLKGDPKNVRAHGERNIDSIKQSLTRYGQQKPVVVMEDGTVIAGNGMLAAARALGWKNIAVVRTSLSGLRATAYAIADNRTAELAEWDGPTLKSILDELKPTEYNLDEMFQKRELEKIIAEYERKHAPDASEDDVPTTSNKSIVKTGEIWNLGNHKLMCGDSADNDSIGKLTRDALIDLVVTSPPYNVGIAYKDHDDNATNKAYWSLIKCVMSECYNRTRPGRAIVWNVGVSPKTKPYMHAGELERVGYQFYRQLIWQKTGIAFPVWEKGKRYGPEWKHEMLYVFSKGTFDLLMDEKNDKYKDDVWIINAAMSTRDLPGKKTKKGTLFNHKDAVHPAAYPVAVPYGCILHMSHKGDFVLDPFGGAGTTLIAAEQLERRALLIEISPSYCDVIIARWEKFTGKTAERVLADG